MTIGRWATKNRISRQWAHSLAHKGRIEGAKWDDEIKRWDIPEDSVVSKNRKPTDGFYDAAGRVGNIPDGF